VVVKGSIPSYSPAHYNSNNNNMAHYTATTTSSARRYSPASSPRHIARNSRKFTSSCEKSAEYDSGFLLVGESSRPSVFRLGPLIVKKPFRFIASRQKIPLLRIDNPAVDIGHIFPATATQPKEVHYSSSQRSGFLLVGKLSRLH
jgi:hypothetical protein